MSRGFPWDKSHKITRLQRPRPRYSRIPQNSRPSWRPRWFFPHHIPGAGFNLLFPRLGPSPGPAALFPDSPELRGSSRCAPPGSASGITPGTRSQRGEGTVTVCAPGGSQGNGIRRERLGKRGGKVGIGISREFSPGDLQLRGMGSIKIHNSLNSNTIPSDSMRNSHPNPCSQIIPATSLWDSHPSPCSQIIPSDSMWDSHSNHLHGVGACPNFWGAFP